MRLYEIGQSAYYKSPIGLMKVEIIDRKHIDYIEFDGYEVDYCEYIIKFWFGLKIIANSDKLF